MKLETLQDRELIERIVAAEIEGAFVISGTSGADPDRGTASFGPGLLPEDRSFRFLEHDEGDRVLLGKYPDGELTFVFRGRRSALWSVSKDSL